MTVNAIGWLVIVLLAIACVHLIRKGNREGDGGMGSCLVGLVCGFLAFVGLLIAFLRWAQP